MSHTPGELIIRDVSEFENVKAYSIEKLENGDRSIVCKLHESSICPEHFPGQTVLDLAHLFKAAPAMKEALEAIEVEYREMMGVSLTENYSHKRDKRHQAQYRNVYEALTLANGKDKES